MYTSYASHSNGGAVQLVGLLLIGGPALIFSGLRELNEKRLLENTPRSKVRSAALGVVELRGTAVAKAPDRSPISDLACCWWHCRIEELRSTGKSSYWATLRDQYSTHLFYLQDETGRVLVDPARAELHVLSQTTDVNFANRSQIEPILQGWGVSDSSFFFGHRRLRIIEEVIADQAPLTVLGELVSLAEPPQMRQQRLRAYLEAAKKDPARMAEADANKDDAVDAEEWDAFRQKLEEEFTMLEARRQAAAGATQESVLVKAPLKGNFVISTGSAQELEQSLAWKAPACMLGGLTASAVGVWLALLYHWPPVIIVGCVVVGCVMSLWFKKGALSWSGSFWSS